MVTKDEKKIIVYFLGDKIMKAVLDKNGFLELTPETEEEYKILKYMSEKSGVFQLNGTTHTPLAPIGLGNWTATFIAVAGWYWDKGLIEKILGK